MSKLEWALWLARHGLRVFPLIPGGKKPAIDNFPAAATTDEQQIRTWWSNRVDYNIAVCTTGIVVIDVDTKKGRDGPGWYDIIGGHYNTFVVKTATGGYHCYFNGPDSMLAVGIMPGIDVRGYHGYVVAPGSVTSRYYEDCVDGEYTVYNDAPIVEVPDGVKAFLKPPIHRVRDDNIELDKESSITHAATWLQTAEPAIEGQGGNDKTYRISARLVRDFALTPETAYQLLLSHWNHRCVPPWSNEELWRLVNNAAEYGKGDAGALLPENYFSGVKPVDPPAVQPPPIAVNMGVRLGNAVDPYSISPRPWKVEKLLMNGDVTVLAGMGAAGKSIFELTLAAHWAIGADFGSFRLRVAQMPLRSLVYNAEDDIMEQSRRLYAICIAYGFDYNKVRENIVLMDDRVMRLCFATAERGIVKPDNETLKFAVDTMQDLRIDVGIFDPFLNLHRADENNNGQMLDVLGIMRHIARVTNTGILLSQHTSKGSINADKGDVDSIRGASSIVNSARVGLIMSSITKEDATQFGIKESDRLDFARIDNAKANLFKRTGKAQAWLQWETVALPTKDYIGVPKLVDMQDHLLKSGESVLRLVREALLEEGGSTISTQKAAEYIWKNHPLFMKARSVTTARDALVRLLEQPAQVDDDTLLFDTHNGKVLIKLTRLTGPDRRALQ